MNGEAAENLTYFEQIETGKIPQLLDIVTIDGRLAQVRVAGRHVMFLDDGTAEEINWNNYECEDRVNLALRYAIEHGKVAPPDEGAIARIHFDEDTTNPNLKLECRYFGAFVRKK
jgi:hypothetical protein